MEMTWNQDRESIIAAAELGDAPAKTAAALLVDARKRAADAEHKAQQLQTELAALKAAHAWIKTSERKPEVQEGDCCDVLAVVSEQVLSLNYTNDDSVHPWVDEFSNLYQDYEVTHWMPLPEAPK